MSGSRLKLAGDLTRQLAALQLEQGEVDPDVDERGWTIIPDPRTVGTLDPGKRGTLQIVRGRVKTNPVAPQAQFTEQLFVWVISHQHEQPAGEDDLDELLDDVLDAIAALGTAGDPEAERLQHPEGHHAYRISLTYITDKEQRA